MPDDLYDRDILVWSEQQAALLRRLAAGERVGDAVDWPHVIEEVGDLGLSELRACRSLLRQAILHLLKVHLHPDGPVDHWLTETAGFLADARAAFTPSMRRRLDVGDICADAVAQLRSGGDVGPYAAVAQFTIDDLLARGAEVGALVARFGP